MITLNCDNCIYDGNCVCQDLRERKRKTKMNRNSEAYLPGRVIELLGIVNNIDLGNLWPNAEFRIYEVDHWKEGCLLWLDYEEPDVNTGEICKQSTREWYIHKGATESEVLRTIHKLLLGSMEHRLDEHLTYKGRRIYDPHRPVADE